MLSGGLVRETAFECLPRKGFCRNKAIIKRKHRKTRDEHQTYAMREAERSDLREG